MLVSSFFSPSANQSYDPFITTLRQKNREEIGQLLARWALRQLLDGTDFKAKTTDNQKIKKTGSGKRHSKSRVYESVLGNRTCIHYDRNFLCSSSDYKGQTSSNGLLTWKILRKIRSYGNSIQNSAYMRVAGEESWPKA